MKRRCLLLLATLAAGTLRGDPASLAGGRFEPIGLDYKKPKVLSDSFFNPFKVQVGASLSKKDGAAVTNESVAEAIGLRGVSGIVYGPGGMAKRAIIGDDVFTVGDELNFSDPTKEEGAPLVPGVSVILREIGRRSLGVDVSGDGEAPRRVTFPLVSFRKP